MGLKSCRSRYHLTVRPSPWRVISSRKKGWKGCVLNIQTRRQANFIYKSPNITCITVFESDRFDSLHSLVLHAAKGSVGAEWSTGSWQNMNGGGWRVMEGMTGWGQGWHTPHSRYCLCSRCVPEHGCTLKAFLVMLVVLCLFLFSCTCQESCVTVCHLTSHRAC